MDPFLAFWILLIGIIIGVIFGVTLVHRTAVYPLHKKIEKLTNEKQPPPTTDDEIAEQFDQVMEQYPYPAENFRFIGSPIDGIQFEDDQILFVEFKTNELKPTPVQQKVKKLVENGKIRWFEFQVK